MIFHIFFLDLGSSLGIISNQISKSWNFALNISNRFPCSPLSRFWDPPPSRDLKIDEKQGLTHGCLNVRPGEIFGPNLRLGAIFWIRATFLELRCVFLFFLRDFPKMPEGGSVAVNFNCENFKALKVGRCSDSLNGRCDCVAHVLFLFLMSLLLISSILPY